MVGGDERLAAGGGFDAGARRCPGRNPTVTASVAGLLGANPQPASPDGS
jgi:hypothetical protein